VGAPQVHGAVCFVPGAHVHFFSTTTTHAQSGAPQVHGAVCFVPGAHAHFFAAGA
jgi:predicted RNA-binding protein with TRAM domain